MRKFVATPEHIEHFHKSGTDMLAAGLSVPVPLEHQADAHALTASERAAARLTNNAGWVSKYEIAPVKDENGKEHQALFGHLDIPDPNIVKKLPHTIRWTSPWINSFTDGDGKKWDGVISHVALTSRPRITKQQPFPSIAAALSVLKPEVQGKPMALSRAGLLADGKPLYPMAFALWSGVKLADMPAEKKPKEPPPGKDAPPSPKGEEKEGMETPETGEKPGEMDMPGHMGMPGERPEESLIDADGDISAHHVLCELMKVAGIPVDEGVTKETFLHHAFKALMEHLKGKVGSAEMAKQNEPPANTPPGGSAPPPPLTAEQPPLYMSLEDMAKKAKSIADPNQRQLMEAMLSLQKKADSENGALRNAAFSLAGKTRNSRLDRLYRRLPTARAVEVKKRIDAMLPNAKFALSEDGTVTDSLDDALSLLEEGLVDLPELTRAHVNFTEEPVPKEYKGTMSDERAEELAARMTRHEPQPAA